MSSAQAIVEAITTAGAVDPHQMPEPVWLTEMEELLTARALLDAVIVERLQAGDVRDITVAECGRTTRAWLVEEQHLAPADARRQLWLAHQLPAFPAVADAMADGGINTEHARVIVSCLCQLSHDWREAAQAELIAFAREHDPAMLGRLCRELRIRSGADESAQAAAERMHRDRYLTLDETLGGMLHIDGMLDPVGAATLKAALNALVTATSCDGTDLRSKAQCRADALVDLAALALASADLPEHCGDRAQVVVTVPWIELRDGIAAGEVGHATINGLAISAATARMLACDAGIIPAVLGGQSEVLDLGRSTRTWSRAQRRAAALRDGGCVFPSCQTTLANCQLHHLDHWADHGPSDLANSANVCRFHHWLIHHTPWTLARSRDGTIEVRRT